MPEAVPVSKKSKSRQMGKKPPVKKTGSRPNNSASKRKYRPRNRPKAKSSAENGPGGSEKIETKDS
jgi:hypothetical protein